MQKVKCVVSYEGTHFHGFARQPRLRTVQGEIERVFEELFAYPVETVGASRTDAGVHARAQVFHFALPKYRIAIEKLPYICARRFPVDLALQSATFVDDGFDARRSVLWKTYRYTIVMRRVPDVFLRRYALHEPQPLDLDAMRDASVHLLGEHDFSSFCAAKAQQASKIRTVHRIHFAHDEQTSRLDIDITGNGFLHHMVRIIVGTLLEVGKGQLQSEDVERILHLRDRRAAGPTAPAHGLCLRHIEYPNMLDSLDDV